VTSNNQQKCNFYENPNGRFGSAYLPIKNRTCLLSPSLLGRQVSGSLTGKSTYESIGFIRKYALFFC
jgi:hypothetical protein